MTIKQHFTLGVVGIFCALLVANCGIFAPRNAAKTENSTRYNRQTVGNVVQKARSFTGSPYKYGGTTAAGFDCSGLVTVAFQSVNLALPRSSYDMATVGREVKTNNIQIGDLVFFVTSKTGDRINHVGIVTDIKKDGEIRFIHASDSGVREDNLGSKYYKSTFVKAMRPF